MNPQDKQVERTQHTPGPWETKQLGQYGFLNIVESRNGKTPIAFTGVDKTLRSQNENEANARLIAAAPELFEACKLMLDYSRYQEANSETAWSKCVGCNQEEGHAEACPTIQLRAAIAKAEGK